MSLDYDVTLIGGGLAGQTLALQLIQARPDLRVLVLEKAAFPVNEAAHKVGESSVELGAWYFSEILGLGQHIRENQLPKFGLRFFFKDEAPRDHIEQGLELGVTSFFPTPSFQFDRGRMENALHELNVAAGVRFLDGCRVSDCVVREVDGPHEVRFERQGTAETVTTRWLIDASGRAGILKRRLGLAEKVDHPINAVWFRVNARIAIDDWCDDAAWQRNQGEPKRWLSTNHLMGRGYWVWLIPLASGATSIGIVADPALHPLSEFNRFDRAMDWLARHEPRCARAIEDQRDGLQDFLALKHFAHGCRQVFSAKRWALTGEAGYFPDPFYSPGSDFIAISNTYITDLILKDLAGKKIKTLASIYDQMYRTLFENILLVYRDQYPLFGNMRVMPLKIIWDYAVYWSFPAFMFIHGRLCDTRMFLHIRSALERLGELNREMQAFFRDWDALDRPELPRTFLNQTDIGLLYELNAGLRDSLDDDGFRQRLAANVAMLEQLASEITRRAARLHTSLTASTASEDDNALLEEVFTALAM